jgi:hypothetical protein
MPTPRNLKRLAWVGVTAVSIGAGAFWALVPTGGDDQERAGAEAPDEAASASEGSPGAAAEWARLQRTLEDLARSDAIPAARKQALDALPAAADPSTKISLLLAAIDGDPAEPERDPMWTDLVQAIAGLWQNDTLGWGTSLMHTETRPKARLAVISSLARMAATERARGIADEHRELLKNNLIDLFNGLPAGQKPEVLAGLEKIASRDVVAVLQGRGLYDESLDSHKPYVQAREQGRAAGQAHAKAEAEATEKMLAEARAQAAAATSLEKAAAVVNPGAPELPPATATAPGAEPPSAPAPEGIAPR